MKGSHGPDRKRRLTDVGRKQKMCDHVDVTVRRGGIYVYVGMQHKRDPRYGPYLQMVQMDRRCTKENAGRRQVGPQCKKLLFN